MRIDFDHPWVRRIFSVIVAIALFAFVNYENQSRFQTSDQNHGASIQGSEIITNLPIEVNVDPERYFVSGVPDSATLRLEGPQAVLFQTVATQSFTVTTPDLNELGEGTHSIELQVEGISSDLTASISPPVINITIEEKVVEEYELSVEISEDLSLAEGFEVSEPNLANNFVTVSGSASTMERIDRVVVEVTSDETDIKSDILLSAPVLVLDEDGTPLNVNVNPSSVEIHAPVVRNQKQIPVVLNEGTGRLAEYNYTVSLNDSESEMVTVKGDPTAIAEISNLPITVDFDGITESTVVTIPVGDLPEGIEEISKDEVDVLIEVSQNNQNNRSND